MSRKNLLLFGALFIAVMMLFTFGYSENAQGRSKKDSDKKEKKKKRSKNSNEWIVDNIKRHEQFNKDAEENAEVGEGRIMAMTPKNDATDVPLVPEFGWQVGGDIGNIHAVTFALYTEEELRKDESMPVWVVIALKDLNHFILFKEPDSVHALGSLREKGGLEPDTVYFWRVTAVGDDGVRATGFFKFRTRK